MVKEEGSESCDSSGPPTSTQQSSTPAGGGGAGGEDKAAEGADVKKEEGDEETKVRGEEHQFKESVPALELSQHGLHLKCHYIACWHTVIL